MGKDKETDLVEQERKDLEDALEHKLFRDVLWAQVIEPSHVLSKCESNDPIANARFLGMENVAKDLIENIKDVKLEAYFAMIKDNQFKEEGDKE